MKTVRIMGIVVAAALLILMVAVWLTGREPDRPGVGVGGSPSPFPAFVAAAGVVETPRGDIAIGTPAPGIVASVEVLPGDRVEAGQELLGLDAREATARLAVATARLQQTTADLAAPLHRLQYLQRLNATGPDLVARDMVTAARDAVGAAQANVAAARSERDQARVALDLLVVRAPAAMRVLQVNARPGQYADNAPGAAPLVLLGRDDALSVRVSVDQSDAWRVHAGAPAVASIRGRPETRIPLRFAYIEPYVAARQVITGQSTERADLRTLQVVYSVGAGAKDLYLGQQVDVYIQARTAAPHAATRR